MSFDLPRLCTRFLDIAHVDTCANSSIQACDFTSGMIKYMSCANFNIAFSSCSGRVVVTVNEARPIEEP